jgi:hypothetical protein
MGPASWGRPIAARPQTVCPAIAMGRSGAGIIMEGVSDQKAAVHDAQRWRGRAVALNSSSSARHVAGRLQEVRMRLHGLGKVDSPPQNGRCRWREGFRRGAATAVNLAALGVDGGTVRLRGGSCDRLTVAAIIGIGGSRLSFRSAARLGAQLRQGDHRCRSESEKHHHQHPHRQRGR